MIKNPPSNAGYLSSIPGGGTLTPHAGEQLEKPTHDNEDPAPCPLPPRKNNPRGPKEACAEANIFLQSLT